MKNLPKKRGAAGALFRDELGNILLLEPTYKDNWEIPGGIIEEHESPCEACEREIFEELGIKKKLGKLLCLEYQREQDDSYMFIFDGGILSDNDIKNITLQSSEIKSLRFYTLPEAKKIVLEKMLLRLEKSLKALEDNNTIYYETIYKAR